MSFHKGKVEICSNYSHTRASLRVTRPSRRLTCAAAAAETEGDGGPGAAASVREISTADWRGGRGHGTSAARLRSVALDESSTTTFLFRI